MKQLTFILLFILISSCIFGQKKFSSFKTEDNVDFLYRFKKEKCFKKDSDLQLVLRIKNNNTEAVNIGFTVNYYWQLQNKAESEPVSICIKPGKRKSGGRAGLVFPATDFSAAQLKSTDFKFDLTELSITKTAGCK